MSSSWAGCAVCGASLTSAWLLQALEEAQDESLQRAEDAEARLEAQVCTACHVAAGGRSSEACSALGLYAPLLQ